MLFTSCIGTIKLLLYYINQLFRSGRGRELTAGLAVDEARDENEAGATSARRAGTTIATNNSCLVLSQIPVGHHFPVFDCYTVLSLSVLCCAIFCVKKHYNYSTLKFRTHIVRHRKLILAFDTTELYYCCTTYCTYTSFGDLPLP